LKPYPEYYIPRVIGMSLWLCHIICLKHISVYIISCIGDLTKERSCVVNRITAWWWYSFKVILNMVSTDCLCWSSGKSSWLQIRRSRVRFPGTTRKKVVGLERGPLSLVSTSEELLGRNSSGSGLEIREYGHRDSSHWPRGTL
jgi:hypothetical protein